MLAGDTLPPCRWQSRRKATSAPQSPNWAHWPTVAKPQRARNQSARLACSCLRAIWMRRTHVHERPAWTCAVDQHRPRRRRPSIMRCSAICRTAPTRRKRLRQLLLAADREFALATCPEGLLLRCSPSISASVPAAREALETARRLSAGATGASARTSRRSSALDRRRHRRHAARTWEQILDEHPLDVLAFRLHHFLAFWHGRPELMAAPADAAPASTGAPNSPAGPHSSPAAASRTRRSATTRSPRLRAARPSHSRPATCGPRTASRMSWRCRAAATKASPGSPGSSRTGRAATT